MFAESSKGKDKGSRVMRWRGEQMGSGVGGTVASLRFGGGTTAILPVKGRRPTKRFLNFERLLKEEGNQVGGKDQEGLVVNRDAKFTNFVEFRTHKVIYRRYAGLFFSVCVDITDNELAYLECIHLFVEILDHFFSNVCELDLVFNFHKVYLILDEFILAGELQETSKRAIIERMSELEKLE
ncbi:hypothetical protein F2Q70_00042485 [Brassica cretica]|uniref:AP complex mu/sigma subunit domain-containing protein n=1 Tax=Brassica cretica TaxID=69181 RepID=A0A8S9KLL2_BRACR|nr:hypothetical protein F2Q70_00042485 [Brassica cretica]